MKTRPSATLASWASSSDWPGFSNLYEAFASNVIPRIGKLVADDEDSYRYLVESIRRFPRPPRFRAMVEDAGFVRAAAESYGALSGTAKPCAASLVASPIRSRISA